MATARLRGLRLFGALDRLQIWHKLALLGVVFAVLFAVPTTLFLRQVATGLAQSSRELRGAQSGGEALALLQAISDHRALSAAALAGDTAAASAAAGARKRVDAGFAALADGRLDSRADSPLVAALEGWKALGAAVESKVISAGDSNGSHAEVAANTAAALESMLDGSGLAADADGAVRHSARIAFLNVPALAEAMGAAEAQGIALLAARKASPEDRTALSGQLARVKERQGELRAAAHKAMAQSVDLQEVLAAPLQAADAGVDQALKATRVEVIFSQDLAAMPLAHHDLHRPAADAQYALARVSGAEIRKVLEARETVQRFEILAFVAAALAIFAGALVFAVWTTRSITRPLGHAVRVADGIAAGHLDHAIDAGRAKNAEAARLLTAFRSMQAGLSDLMREVQSAGQEIRLASTQVAYGNADLAERTEQQASSLEETAATMEELASAVKSTAQNADRATGMVSQASEAAMRGSEAVASAVTTMQAINDKSRRIVDIISVIDGIAFQTNILALNAAVEAARAGEQGRGFAVVAAEVRSLAQRSAQAAREIKQLIGEAVEASREGTLRVDESGKAMDDIMDSVQRVAAVFGEIAAASSEQRNGIDQVEKAVTAMDRSTQENAALVGEVASSAQSLEQQAERLAGLISRFRLGGEAPSAAGPSHPARPARAMAARPGVPRLSSRE